VSTEQTLIPLCVPHIAGNEWVYLKECLDTGWVSSVGGFVDRFENELAERVGVRCAVATNTGTAALHVALQVAGVEEGDEVLVSALTFIASANAIHYIGARPYFVDAEPVHWQMDPAKLADCLEHSFVCRDGALYNKSTGRRLKAVMPVHILGQVAEIEEIVEIAHRYGLAVIEDATEALGARVGSDAVGHTGDIACFSFNGNKIITTGGGGMMVTDNDDWARNARSLTTQAKADPVEYIHEEVGYNYRLTNIQAAMGCAQLEKLDEYVAEKRRIAEEYDRAFASVTGIEALGQRPGTRGTYWLYTILVDEDVFAMNSRSLMRALERAAIQSRPVWQPLHLSPAYAGEQATDCSIAERIYKRALSLPCSVDLGEQQTRVVEQILSLESS
jgi:perosamine synthetase